MATNESTKTAWRKWFAHAELSQLLQTEQMIPGANSRDITISGQGKYVAGIKISCTAVVTAGDAEAPIAGASIMDFFLSNLRIKSQGKLTEQIFTSASVMDHLHRIYLDKNPVVFAETFGGAGPGTVTATWYIPCAMEGPFNITFLSNLLITDLYAADVVFTAAQMQINVISSDIMPPAIMAFSSQTINPPATGNWNLTTLTEGFLRESVSFMGFTAGQITNFQYVQPDGRGSIYAQMADLASQFQVKYQTVMGTTSAACASETCIETSYLSGGVPLPWSGAGRVVLTTAALATTPTVIEVLVGAPVSQQLATGEKAQPTSQRPRTDLAAGAVATGPKPKVKY